MYNMSHIYEICDIFTTLWVFVVLLHLWYITCLRNMWHIYELCDTFTTIRVFVVLLLAWHVTYLRNMWHIDEKCDTFTKYVTYSRNLRHIYETSDILMKDVTYWRKMWHIYDYQSVCGPTHGSCCGISQRGNILTKDEPYCQLPKCVWSHPRILLVQRCPAWLKLHQNPRLSQFCYPRTPLWVVPLEIWHRTSIFSILKLYPTFYKQQPN